MPYGWKVDNGYSFLKRNVETSLYGVVIFANRHNRSRIVDDTIGATQAYCWRDMISEVYSTTKSGTLKVAVWLGLVNCGSG